MSRRGGAVALCVAGVFLVAACSKKKPKRAAKPDPAVAKDPRPPRGATAAWGLCHLGCDPVAQTDCGTNEACYYDDTNTGTTVCWNEGPLALGEDCSSFASFCEAGSDCVLDPGSAPAAYHCRGYCDADAPCPTNFTCRTTAVLQALQVCMPNQAGSVATGRSGAAWRNNGRTMIYLHQVTARISATFRRRP